jgi:hypothetical protein
MTTFTKQNLVTRGESVFYNDRFVARFKHRGPVTKAKFLKALVFGDNGKFILDGKVL